MSHAIIKRSHHKSFTPLLRLEQRQVLRIKKPDFEHRTRDDIAFCAKEACFNKLHGKEVPPEEMHEAFSMLEDQLFMEPSGKALCYRHVEYRVTPEVIFSSFDKPLEELALTVTQASWLMAFVATEQLFLITHQGEYFILRAVPQCYPDMEVEVFSFGDSNEVLLPGDEDFPSLVYIPAPKPGKIIHSEIRKL
jgi:hypothetical protein